MPFNFSTGEIMLALLVAILVFGGRLPQIARKVARSVGDFRRGMNEEMRRIDAATRVDDAPPPDWSQPPDGADCDGFGRIDSEGIGDPPESEDSQEPEGEAARSVDGDGEQEKPAEPA